MRTIYTSNLDLCIIFGNLVENAVEACNKQIDHAKLIEIRTDMRGSQLATSVGNTYQEEVTFKDDQYYSTKHEGIGIGLSSVKKVVEKYDGSLKIYIIKIILRFASFLVLIHKVKRF